jgi:hypothetical protein
MSNQTKINSGKTLGSAIQKIIEQSFKAKLYDNALKEKERQKGFLGEEDDDVVNDAPADDSKQSAPSKTIDDEKDKLSSGEIEPADVVDKLNTIRSGKSFKDESISRRMEEYVNSLSKAEKVALLSFLKGIAQIVTGEIEAKNADEPGDHPADIAMQKGEKKQSKSIEPNVIHAPAKKTEKKPSAENTDGPTPIVPKKK